MLQSGDTEWVPYYQHWSWSLQGPHTTLRTDCAATLGLAFWQMLKQLCWSILGNSNIGLYWALYNQGDLQSTLPGVSLLKVSPQAVKGRRLIGSKRGEESASTGILFSGSWQPWSEQPSSRWALILIMLFFTDIQEAKAQNRQKKTTKNQKPTKQKNHSQLSHHLGNHESNNSLFS